MLRGLRRRYAVIIALMSVALAVEMFFAPVDPILASPPTGAGEIVCPSTPLQSFSAGQVGCAPVLSAYKGAGSLTYCFLGMGSLYVHGVYYPLVQPGQSLARQINSALCPAMRP